MRVWDATAPDERPVDSDIVQIIVEAARGRPADCLPCRSRRPSARAESRDAASTLRPARDASANPERT